MSLTRTDRDHLNTLSICHYILGGLCFVFGAFPALYLATGIAIVLEAPGPARPNGPPPEFLGWLFIGFAAFALLFCWLLAVGLALAGWFLSQRRRRVFCLVVAGFSCLFKPLGTALGICTLIVLSRRRVREAFEPVEPDREAPSEFDTYHSE